jgi:hypothetical protein
MGWKLSFCTIALALAFAGFGMSAEAQPQKRSTYAAYTKRPPTRVTVTRRSYLDAGREYLPGHPRPFNEYVWPPNWVPSTSYDIANQQVPILYPVPNLFWLPGWQP